MVYDREMGSMRVLLVSPLPRWYLLRRRSCSPARLVAVLQVYVFLAVAWFWEVEPPPFGYLAVLPALLLAGLMLGSLGLLLSSVIRQLENFAGVMNFVIFPMFFASSALYPLWRMRESSVLLWQICSANPFTHAVELIRFALHRQFAPILFLVPSAARWLFLGIAILGYDPARGFMQARRPA